jgi:hypothetical protein
MVVEMLLDIFQKITVRRHFFPFNPKNACRRRILWFRDNVCNIRNSNQLQKKRCATAFFGLIFLIGFSGIIAVCGCAFISNYKDLSVLSEIGKDQYELDREARRQEKLSAVLRKDLLAGKLHRGVSQAQVIESYGEPVLIKNNGSNSSGQVFLYRKPTDYFSKERVYLYFNNHDKLINWEVE